MDSRTLGAASSYALPDKRFALLIDADNVSAKYLKPILDELSKYGTVTYKRIYGDWTLSLHAKWKSALLENSITPIQQFGYTQGKNATDSAMIIDAMDILYTNSVEGFCIVSSDSDFTRLAARLRESGVTVIGMGEKKTPVPFRTACDVFVTLELLTGAGRRRGKASSADADSAETDGPTASKHEIEQAVVDIITDNTNNGKATGLGEIGSRLQKRYPDFDVRSYGTNLLSKLLSEFSSVHIAKAGSNVMVELADSSQSPKADEEGVVAEGDAGESADTEHKEGVEGDVAAEDDGDSHRSRRRRRGRRGGRGNRSAEESKSATEEEPIPSSEEDVAAPAQEVETGREAKRGKVAPEADVAQEPTVEADESEVDLEEVQAFILATIEERGADGIAIGDLNKTVRRKFKTFRVTRTGFRNLRLYVGSLEGVEIEKREDDRYAVHA